MQLFTITFQTIERRKLILDRVAWWFSDEEQARRFGEGIIRNEGLLGLVGEEYRSVYASKNNSTIAKIEKGVTNEGVRAPNGELFSNAIYVPDEDDLPF